MRQKCVYYVLCVLIYISYLCFMSYNYCLFYVLCLICNVLCLMSYVLCLMGHYLKIQGGIMVVVVYREVPRQNPRGRSPRWFWPRDLWRHNIHHDTSKVFVHKMSFLQHPGLVKRDFFEVGFGQWTPQGVHWTLYRAWTANIGRVKFQYTSPGCNENV